MGMVVRSNIMAYNANRQLGMNNSAVAKSLEKLASGFRINRAGDDASGLAISEKMKAQIKGLETASANSQDGISLVQTAEGALTEVHSMLNRMVELATKSANGTMQDKVDREALQAEVESLKSEINRIAAGTNFNGINLLDGSMAGAARAFTAGTAGTGDGTVAGTAGTASEMTLDFSKIDIEAGATITIGDTTLEFVKDAADVTAGNTAVVIGATKDDTLTALATELETAAQSATAGNWGAGATATAANGVITITSDAPAAGDAVGNAGAPAYAEFAIKTTGFGLTLQVGDTAASFNQVSVSVGDMSATGLGIADLDIGDRAGAAAAIDTIKAAINTVSSNRADLGAVQNRLEYTINNLDVAAENMSAANSRIRDTDMAKEMMNYTKMNVLTQAAQAMLAQANQQPQSVLQLLQ